MEETFFEEYEYLTDTSLPSLLKKLNTAVEKDEAQAVGGLSFQNGEYVQLIGYFGE